MVKCVRRTATVPFLTVLAFLTAAILVPANAQQPPNPEVVRGTTSPLSINLYEGDQSVFFDFELHDPTGLGIKRIHFQATRVGWRNRVHGTPLSFSGYPTEVSGRYELVFPSSLTPGTYEIEYIIEGRNRNPSDWNNWFADYERNGTNVVLAFVEVTNQYVPPPPPEFVLTQSLRRDCNSFGTEHRRVCAYDLTVGNSGGLHDGGLDVQVATNLHVNAIFMFNGRTPLSCDTSALPQRAEFHSDAGSVQTAQIHTCSLANVSLDTNGEISLSYQLRADKSNLVGLAETPMVCATVSASTGQAGAQSAPGSCLEVVVDP